MAAIPSINLATDSLGLGSIFQGFTNAAGTAQCGSKPTCISFGKNSNCAQKTRAYEECIKTNAQANLMVNQVTTRKEESVQEPNTKIYLAVGVLVVALLLILLMRR